jgi:hypothetical protein
MISTPISLFILSGAFVKHVGSNAKDAFFCPYIGSFEISISTNEFCCIALDILED